MNCQNFASCSFMCMLGLSSAIKGKIISHYPHSCDAIYRLPFNQAIFPCIQNSQQKTFNLLFCRCEPLGNFRKFEKFQTKHFVPLLQCKRSKVNTNSKPSERKWEWSPLKWISLSPKYLQSSLNYNFNLVKSHSAVLNWLTYLFLQHTLLHQKYYKYYPWK